MIRNKTVAIYTSIIKNLLDGSFFVVGLFVFLFFSFQRRIHIRSGKTEASQKSKEKKPKE